MNTTLNIIFLFLILLTLGYILVNLTKFILVSFVIYFFYSYLVTIHQTNQDQQTSKDDVTLISIEEIVYKECLELTERPDLCKELINENI